MGLFSRIKVIKKIHTMISLFIFFSILFYSIFKVNLSLSNNPLSKLGTYEETNILWALALITVSVSIIVNATVNIIEWNLKYKKITSCLFYISAGSLIGLAIVNMGWSNIIHNTFAGIFFFGYTVSIFFTGIQLIDQDFRIAMISIAISILMLSSGIWLLLELKSSPEIVFIILSFLWNFIILYPSRFKNILKLFNF